MEDMAPFWEDIDLVKRLCLQDLIALNLGCTRGKESDEIMDGDDGITIWISPDGESWSYSPLVFIKNSRREKIKAS